MSEPIKAGDLVVVVRGAECCGTSKTVGAVLTVKGPAMHKTQRCGRCGDRRLTEDDLRLSNGYTYKPYRLKRIPPLSELEGEKRDEELTV